MLGSIRITKALAQMKCLTIAELAYMAGIVDGEGCIGIYEIRSRPNGRTKIYTNLYPRLCIANTDRRLFEWLLPRIPGARLYMKATSPQSRKWKKNCGSLICEGARAAALCKMLLPYLVIKQVKAALVVEFYEGNTTCGRGIPVTQEEQARRLAILARFEQELLQGRDAPHAEWPIARNLDKTHYV